MSEEKKPGFFKRLFTALTGSEEPKEKAEKPKAKAPAKRAKKPAAKNFKAKQAAKSKSAAKPKTATKASAAKTSAVKKARASGKARPKSKPTLWGQEVPPASADVIPFPEPQPEPEVEPQAEPEAPDGETPKKEGWFARLRDGLSKTSSQLTQNITAIFTKRKLDDEMLQELEDALIQADLGVDMAIRITQEVARGRYDKEIAPEEVRAVLGSEVAKVLEPMAQPLVVEPGRQPHVILMVGVNGTGKTTTIGKLAHQFAAEGKRTVLAAGDTFRAAAVDQLKIWGQRANAPVISGKEGADAASLAFDALQQAREDKADVLMIDTAGRLQNKADLMDELAKIVRVIKKLDESAPHSVILVLDATTGQNAVSQAKVFREIAGVTGIIMTKLDGTARGGILVAIAEQFELPIHAICVGETSEDLQAFDAYDFAAAIAGAPEQVEA